MVPYVMKMIVKHSLIHVNIQKKKRSHSKEKRVEEKEVICLPKVQEGKEETIFTREQEEKEEIIHIREE